MKVNKVIKLIEADGWYLARTKGSHRQAILDFGFMILDCPHK